MCTFPRRPIELQATYDGGMREAATNTGAPARGVVDRLPRALVANEPTLRRGPLARNQGPPHRPPLSMV